MATGNGNKLWQAVGAAGLVIGLVGGTIGIVTAAGPGHELERFQISCQSENARQDVRTTANEVRSIANEKAVAIINTKLDTLLEDVKIIKAAVR